MSSITYSFTILAGCGLCKMMVGADECTNLTLEPPVQKSRYRGRKTLPDQFRAY